MPLGVVTAAPRRDWNPSYRALGRCPGQPAHLAWNGMGSCASPALMPMRPRRRLASALGQPATHRGKRRIACELRKLAQGWCPVECSTRCQREARQGHIYDLTATVQTRMAAAQVSALGPFTPPHDVFTGREAASPQQMIRCRGYLWRRTLLDTSSRFRSRKKRHDATDYRLSIRVAGEYMLCGCPRRRSCTTEPARDHSQRW